ncbi:MAG: ribbon-helix-helix domain-containing protein [Dermatophilaceae bacterium]
MKLSVSLPDEDIDLLDGYAHEQGIQSRSAAVHRAIRLLRASQLESACAEAWEVTTRDGLAQR